MIYKNVARNILFPFLMNIGIDKLMLKQSNNSFIHIMYHGVVKDNSNYFSPRHITSSQFEQHLLYYKKNFDIISVEEAFENSKNDFQYKRKTISISFDDGFENNYTNALPLLEKHKTKATIFVSSSCVNENEWLWTDFIAALNYFYKDQEIEVDNYSFINSFDKKKKISLPDLIKTTPYSTRDELIQKIADKYGMKEKLLSLPSEVWKLLNRSDLINLSKSPFIDIGSHGHSHFNLANITAREARIELETSKKLLESTIDKKTNIIAYPDGSYNNKVKDIAEEIGFKYQLAVKYKETSDINDKRIMSRYGISNTTTYESNMLFLAKSF